MVYIGINTNSSVMSVGLLERRFFHDVRPWIIKSLHEKVHQKHGLCDAEVVAAIVAYENVVKLRKRQKTLVCALDDGGLRKINFYTCRAGT